MAKYNLSIVDDGLGIEIKRCFCRVDARSVVPQSGPCSPGSAGAVHQRFEGRRACPPSRVPGGANQRTVGAALPRAGWCCLSFIGDTAREY